MRRLLLALAIMFGVAGLASAAPGPTVTKATEGIFGAFGTHPLVGLAEYHNLAQELDFYVTLLGDPRFASEVGNVVLETGSAAHQDIVDRYVNGGAVPYADLRKVWDDTTWNPTVGSIGSLRLYAVIRDINHALPPEKRIKVWLGGAPVDWPQIKRADWDWNSVTDEGERYLAGLIEREILGKSRKALVIYGGYHFGIYPPGFHFPAGNVRNLIDRAHPGALFVIWPYVGYATANCAARFEKHISNWPTPALVGPIQGSAWEKDVWQPGCGALPRLPQQPQAEYDVEMRNFAGLTGDALLYLGPRSQQVNGPYDPTIYLDLDRRAELDRRNQIKNGRPLDYLTAPSPPMAAVPKPFWPN